MLSRLSAWAMQAQVPGRAYPRRALTYPEAETRWLHGLCGQWLPHTAPRTGALLSPHRRQGHALPGRGSCAALLTGTRFHGQLPHQGGSAGL